MSFSHWTEYTKDGGGSIVLAIMQAGGRKEGKSAACPLETSFVPASGKRFWNSLTTDGFPKTYYSVYGKRGHCAKSKPQ